MKTYTEHQILLLRNGQFGSKDPRTPSLASKPGMSLSFENLAKIKEAQQRDLDYIQTEKLRSEEERRKYWSDNQHLADKLASSIQFVASHYNLFPESLSGAFSIVRGTGQVVIKLGDAYHYVEIYAQDTKRPVYISENATLPESQIPLLATATDLEGVPQ